MAAELPRPGVEIIEEFRSTSPSIITPTLVPFVTGPAKEIVEVTTSDGLINSEAKQGTYTQLPKTISQTSFPSPRGNITEVDVDEDTIKAFFLFGGSLKELLKGPGESFLTSWNNATAAALKSKEITSGSGLILDGLTIVLAIDQPAVANVTEDVIVTFASVTLGGGAVTDEEIADQINTAVGETVATVVTSNSNTRVLIKSTKYGALSSVTLRAGGSGNTVLGASSASVEYRVTGSGFRAQDLSNNTTISPWIEWTRGVYLEDRVVTSFPGVGGGTGVMFFGLVNGSGTFTSAQASDVTFTGNSSIDLKASDQFWADGVQPNTSSLIMKVESTRFKLGTLNTKLSTFDDEGDVVTAVYDDSAVGTLLNSSPFSPRYAWFEAENLSVSTTPTAAVLTGATSGAAATVATVEGSTTISTPATLAGLTLIFQVTEDSVLGDAQTFTFTGGPFAAVDDIVSAINDAVTATTISGIVAINSSDVLNLTTLKTGATQAITVKSTGTANSTLKFSTSADTTGTGTDVEFVDIAPVLLSAAHTFNFSYTSGETLIVQISTNGGSSYGTSRTFTFAASSTAANIAALVALLNTGSSWDGSTLPTQFTISASGSNKIKITGANAGSSYALRIGSSSTAIGVTTNSDLQFTSLQKDIGEDELNGLTLKLKLNSRPKTYEVLFVGNSLVDAVDNINTVVGWPVATIGGDDDDVLVITSDLKGYASKVEVIDDSTSTEADRSLGFESGNQTAYGTGRPNPDFYVDDSGNVILGAEILRNIVTGEPFDPGVADLYIQYHGLRKDVSPSASSPGLLKISDVTTLQTVLSPITTDNPLGLGMFFELINAPGIECAGLGVDETTASAPDGTLEAYTRVANFIESEEVYSIAPLTHDETVAQMFATHVALMSGGEQKGERILLFNPAIPSRAVDTVVVSGLSGNTTATSNEFVVDVNPAASLLRNDINPALDVSLSKNLYLEIIVSDVLRRYNVSAVNGVILTLKTTFTTTENVDSFYTTTTLNSTLVNEDWSLKIRGSELLLSGSTLPDKQSIAETVQAKANVYKNRRLYYVFPDKVRATIDGQDSLIEGYYACAAIAGMIAHNPPQQGFTNLPMTGFTAVVGSNDTFSNKQLNVMAAGGTYILVQDAQGAPLVCRHQLSTNITTIETRELSITKVVDYVAKFLRIGLRNFIGTFNINQPFLDTLSVVIHGMLKFLEENGIILGGDLNNIIQSKDSPDVVLVDVTLNIPFPCNYIRLTLVV